MPSELLVPLTLSVLAVAFLYSCVGHAGASGYIAVMTLFGLAQDDIKPAALFLNILVSLIGTWQFWRAGHFSWRLFWPFAVLSVPMAFVGGFKNLPAHHFKMLVGVVLLFSALRFIWKPSEESVTSAPTKPTAIGLGGVLGLMAGLTGTGGGIFLTPLLLMMRWAKMKEAAAVSALFILVNSVAGLLGNLQSTKHFPVFATWLAGAAVVGGAAGSYCGSRRFDPRVIKILLAVVLVIAGLKLVFTT